MMIPMFVTLLASAEITPGQRIMLKPAATAAAPLPGKAGYYLMQGRTIISAPFANVSDCFKTLAKMRQTPQPGLDTVVCVHRVP